MSLRTKLTLLLAGVFVALGSATVIIELTLMNRLMLRDAEERMRQAIKTAWGLLHAEQARIVTALEVLAQEDGVPLELAARRARIDALAVVGRDGRTLEASFGGERLPALGLPTQASGFAVLAPPLAGLLRPGASSLLVSYASVTARGGRLVGLEVLDGRHELVDAVAGALFPPTVVDGRPLGTVTIFRGDERVATTVRRPDSERALGTRASVDVAAQVLRHGRPWTGRARVLDDWYIARYEPLRDAGGAALGMLYVGELERPFLAARRRVLVQSLILLLGIMAAATLLFGVVGRRMLRQIAEVHDATLRMKSGDVAARSHVHSHDELGDLARAFNDMASELERQRRELTEQKDRAEAANRSYLETLGFVSHELRNALGTAVFNAEALREGSYGPIGSDQQEGLGLVRQSLGYMSDVMNNYLQLSRLEHGELLMKRVPVALARDVIRPAAGLLDPQLQERKMRLEIQVGEDLDVLADPSLLRIVYENLLGNACKYGAAGGLVRASAEQRDDRVVLDVWNEGPGVTSEKLPLLFRKFERLDARASAGTRGTGLGLYISRQIILQHGGEMGAESEAGRWMRIWFSLELSAVPRAL